MTTQIIQNYSCTTAEAYNKINEMFEWCESVNGAQFSKKWNYDKTKVEFKYKHYDLQGEIQLSEGKLVFNGKIHSNRGRIIPIGIPFLGLWSGEEFARKNLKIETNLCSFIKKDLEERFKLK